MKLFVIAFLMVVSALPVKAHELTPTYFRWEPSIYDSIKKTDIQLFNRRSDVEYYEISVFDEDWKPISFATRARVVRLPYLGRLKAEIYVRKKDVDSAVYICTRSLLQKENKNFSAVASRICSKVEK